MRIKQTLFILLSFPLSLVAQDGVLAPSSKKAEKISLVDLPATALREVKLKKGVPIVIPVHSERVTTILLPEAPRAIHANNVTTEAVFNPDAPAQFFMLYPEGTDFFTVRALVESGSTNINVIFNDGEVSVLELVQAQQHHPVVKLVRQANPVPLHGRGSVNLAAKIHSREELIGFIDTAKLYPMLTAEASAAVAGMSVTHPKTHVEYEEGFSVGIIDFWKFDPEKIIVAKLAVSNNSDSPLEFDPESITLHVGNRILPSSITDADGRIGPRTSQHFYAVFDKFSNGDAAAITLKNKMHVSLSPLKTMLVESQIQVPTIPEQELPYVSPEDFDDGGKSVLFPSNPPVKKRGLLGRIFSKRKSKP